LVAVVISSAFIFIGGKGGQGRGVTITFGLTGGGQGSGHGITGSPASGFGGGQGGCGLGITGSPASGSYACGFGGGGQGGCGLIIITIIYKLYIYIIKYNAVGGEKVS
jgi:hypothetical protein